MQQPDVGDTSPRETQRANILEAARRVFARKGKAATMADVAQAAGVSQGLAYRYFAGKEQIYRELVEQAVQQAGLATAPPPAESSATPGRRLALLITRLVEYRRDHLEVFQLLSALALTGYEECSTRIRRRTRSRKRSAGVASALWRSCGN